MLRLLTTITTFISVLPVAYGHFAIEYPAWRGDSFDGSAQWAWPCANISQESSANNRTTWPLTGGSLRLDVSHPWAPTYVNLGLGNEVVSTFNVTLVEGFNQTGNGTFCIREVGRSILEGLANEGLVRDGSNATVQVIQIGHSGSALYNCADITFSSQAQLLQDNECSNSSGVGGVGFVNADGSSGETSSNETGPSDAGSLMVNGLGLVLAATVAIAFGWL